jgi:hypothetical protein
MKCKLRRGASVWDQTGMREQTGFGRVLILDGAKNHHGLVPVRCAQTGQRGYARMEDLEIIG